ncbi:hypothetical protein [Methanolobus vulcani]|uniref:Yip1 domain-containing protein n=1 Tax=Methanolobus vulcani TaxID=38026 RepID=A0A7Z8P3D9_9EURY|nr:hypothetical protein [Methanolobus vulcani]TQD27938.1 hypothetical protein FKV42_02435 [Methanolobus vulcani]
MKLNVYSEKDSGVLDKLGENIKNPKYSIFVILITPLIFALAWNLFSYILHSTSFGDFGFLLTIMLMFIALISPVMVLACYAYFTENKLSSAIMGLLLFPLAFFYAEVITKMVNFQFQLLVHTFNLSHMYSLFEDFWNFSLIHALIGILVTFRKPFYLAIALILLILQFVVFVSYLD